jgi:hypothetical protein
MTTDSWVGGTGTQQFGTEGASDGNWSTGKVPDSSDDVVISTASTTTVNVTSDEDVKSLALGSKDTLAVVSSYFYVQDGTGSNDDGVFNIEGSATVIVEGGTLDNSGSIELTGSANFSAALFINGNTDLDGSGGIVMQGSSSSENVIEGTGGAAPVLFNNEDIGGSGTIGELGLDFINYGTVETGSNGELQIYGTAAVDSGEFVNNSIVEADNGGQVIFGAGAPTTINNNDTIALDSTGNTTQLKIDGNVTIQPSLSGNQLIEMVGSVPGADQIVSAGSPASLTLINETLKGAGTVGDSKLTLTNGSGSVINANNSAGVLFLNTGNNTITNTSTATIEADGGNLGIFSPVDNAGTILALSGGSSAINSAVDNTGMIAALNGSSLTVNTSITNNATVQVGNGGVLVFGNGSTTTIYNNATIALDSTGTATKLKIDGNVTIEPSATNGSGTITLSESYSNSIVSDGNPVTLALSNELLQGEGEVGDGNLTLDVESGATVDADLPAELVIFTGSNTITNAGLLETANNGLLALQSPVDNTGTIAAVDGLVQVFSEISGPGAIEIGDDGWLYLSMSTAGNVDFTAATGGLALNDSLPNGGIGGLISGAVAGDSIDLENVALPGGVHAVWDQTSTGAGTLSIEANGDDLYTLDLAGTYNSLDFSVGTDDFGGILITVQNTPTYAGNSGNNDEWILSNGNWVESAGPGSHPSGYNVALTGDWTGSGTDGILWVDPTTGDADEWQLSNTQWSASVDLGPHPASADGNSFQIAGTDDATDFTGNGIDDVLWTSVNSDGTIATDIWELSSSGNWAASVSPGDHPAGYSVVGTGDWTGDGTDGILWFNSSTGATDEWQLSGGQWAASVDLGSHPANSDGNSFQIAGIGDFFGNGRDGVLWTSVNSDGSVTTDIWELNASGQWMASVSPGSHPAGYSVVAVGDFTGDGTSDILWYNASTGDTDEWLINNGQWAGSIDLGTHPGNYQIAGVGDFNGAGNAGILWHSPS